METASPIMNGALILTMAFPITYGILGGLCYQLARKRSASLLACGLILAIAVLLPIAHVYGGFDHHAFFRYGLSQAEDENTADTAMLFQGIGRQVIILKALSVTSSLTLLFTMVVITEWKRRREKGPLLRFDDFHPKD